MTLENPITTYELLLNYRRKMGKKGLKRLKFSKNAKFMMINIRTLYFDYSLF